VFKVTVLTYKTLHIQQPAYLYVCYTAISLPLLYVLLVRTSFWYRCQTQFLVDVTSAMLQQISGTTPQTQLKTHLPSAHLKLTINPIDLTSSVNTKHNCLLSIWWLPHLSFDFFDHVHVISSRIIITIISINYKNSKHYTANILIQKYEKLIPCT